MKSLVRWWPLLVVFLIALVVAGSYLVGFRVAGGGIDRLHALTITDLPEGAEVYLDATPEGVANKGTLVVQALPGPHAVLANVDRYWPWVSVITMPAMTMSLRALLIPRSVSITQALNAKPYALMLALPALGVPSARARSRTKPV